MRSRMLLLLPWMGFVLVFTSCAILFPDRTAPKSQDYKVTPPPAPWAKLAVGSDPDAVDALKADLAYENPDTGAIISLNSICRKYSDISLDQLTLNLVRGIGKREMLDRKETSLDGADALDTLFKGTVDDVELSIRTVVLTKDGCTYDFIYVSVPEREKLKSTDFEHFLASFRTE